MEVIGTYDPIPKLDAYDNSGKFHKDIKLDVVRARYWIGVGAQPSDTAWRILSMVSLYALRPTDASTLAHEISPANLTHDEWAPLSKTEMYKSGDRCSGRWTLFTWDAEICEGTCVLTNLSSPGRNPP